MFALDVQHSANFERSLSSEHCPTLGFFDWLHIWGLYTVFYCICPIIMLIFRCFIRFATHIFDFCVLNGFTFTYVVFLHSSNKLWTCLNKYDALTISALCFLTGNPTGKRWLYPRTSWIWGQHRNKRQGWMYSTYSCEYNIIWSRWSSSWKC